MVRSLFFTINTFEGKPQSVNFKAEKIIFGNDSFFAICDGESLDDVWRLTVEDEQILRFDCFYCCPDVLAEFAHALNKKANYHGSWFEQVAVNH